MKLAPYRSALYQELQRIDLRLAALAHPEPDGHGDLADRDAAQRVQAGLVETRARLLETRGLCVAALIRVEERTFGQCLSCTEAIPEVRLQAIPWVERCIPCETAREQAQAQERSRNPKNVGEGDI